MCCGSDRHQRNSFLKCWFQDKEIFFPSILSQISEEEQTHEDYSLSHSLQGFTQGNVLHESSTVCTLNHLYPCWNTTELIPCVGNSPYMIHLGYEGMRRVPEHPWPDVSLLPSCTLTVASWQNKFTLITFLHQHPLNTLGRIIPWYLQGNITVLL